MRLTRSVCTECGEEGPPGEQFCVSCGHYLWSSGPPAEVRSGQVKPEEAKPAEVTPAGERPADAHRAAPAGPETEVIHGRVRPARPKDRL